MQITIYSNFSKEANSTKQPSGGTAVNCTLKEDTSVLNPVFILDMTDASINYVSWVIGGITRYYFVTDVVYLRNTTIEVHCKSDPMATFKAAIGASSQYVTRAASASNNYIVDNLYPVTTDISYQAVEFSGLSGHFPINHGGYYVIGVVGQNTGLGIDYYRMTPAEFSAFLRYMYGGSYLDAPLTEISNELQKELVNPLQYIVSVQWYCCDIWNGVQVSSIPFGYWDAPCSAMRLTSLVQKYEDTLTLPAHPQTSGTDREYLYSNPYTRLTLSVLSFGDIALDPSWFAKDKAVAIRVQVDYATGAGTMELFSRTSSGSGMRLMLVHGQIGVPMQISQINQNFIQYAVGIVSTAAAFATGNFMGTLSGVGDAAQGLLPQMNTVGSMASRVAFEYVPAIICTFRNIVSADTVRLGKPLMANRTINTLSGYVQVERPDVDIIGTVQEKDEIIAYMQGGFYYE